MEKQAIITPTYNERENIGLLVDAIVNLKLDSQIIIVDDNSPDGTGELADDLAARSEVPVLNAAETSGTHRSRLVHQVTERERMCSC